MDLISRNLNSLLTLKTQSLTCIISTTLFCRIWWTANHLLLLELGNQISPTPTARNLGVIFDSDFNLIPHINSIIKNCNYHMRQFRRIHKHLDRDTAIFVVNAIVGSCIDYCNSLLYGVHNTYVKSFREYQTLLHVLWLRPPCIPYTL